MLKDRVTSILNKLPEWVESGAVNSEVAEEIRATLDPELDHKLRKQRRAVTLAVAAAVMIGAGIIMLVSWNWHDLTRTAKAGLSFLPWLASTGLLAWVLLTVKTESRLAWVEGSATLQAICLGASLSLIALIYPSGGVLSSLLLLWAVYLLAQTYLTLSIGALTVYLLVCLAYCFASFETSADSGYYWPLLLAALPRLWQICSREITKSAIGLMWVVAMNITSAYVLVWSSAGGMLPFVANAALFAAYLCVSRLLCSREKGGNFASPRARPFELIGEIGIIILAFVMLSDRVWRNPNLEFTDNNMLEQGALLLVLAAALAGSIGFLWKRKDYPALYYAILPVWILVFAQGAAENNAHIASVSMNLFLTLAAVVMILAGVREFKPAKLNIGVLLMAAQIYYRVAASDYPLYIGAMVFIATGVLLLWLNWRLFRTRDQAS